MYRFLCWVGLVWSVACQLGAQGFVWTRQIGNNASPFGDKVAEDSSSNVYIAGAFTGTASFGSSNVTSAGKNDAFLAKYDSSGNLRWVKQAGGAQEDVAGDVAVDTNGNVYVVGGFSGTATFDTTNLTAGESVFIAKYNSSGTLIWVRQTAGVG